ncbi:3-ketoacyl-CoA thiolase [Vibrio astriarenae]|nr:3-ketoacyl-CoA thiolase [Vibrio sp. C7]
MGLGPVSAIANTLTKANMSIDEIELFELNEAFAAQALGVVRSLTQQHHIDEAWLLERCNIAGGAIALGHPIGASGNRVVTTLVHQLRRTRQDYGLASLCIGGGMGTALIIKRC